MNIPKEVQFVIDGLKERGFEAYLVGGCVRDLLRGVEPEDWDVATNARPEEIGSIFLKSFGDNKFGTITVLTDSGNPRLKEIEVTPYRIDEKYSDKRHPDSISWASTIEEDLSRRDFTVNAIAALPALPSLKIIDPYAGEDDLKTKTLRAVGSPAKRFSEDALRLMRAVRFSCGLGFQIEQETAEAIQRNAHWLQAISKERIRDEFLKIIMSERASQGVELLRKLDLLKYAAPEVQEGYGVGQNKHHIYDCYEHSLRSLEYASQKKFNKYVRLAALFHDVGKPRTKRGEGPDSTFYNHEIVGAKMTAQILERLRFPKKDIEKVVKLVRYHLFYYNVGEVSDSSVRRLVGRMGRENMEELLQLRMADRIGSGVPKAEPYKLRHLKYVIEKVSQDPISAKMLDINGDDIMSLLKIESGPKVGQFLDILLGYVLAKPEKNQREILEKELKKLAKLTPEELRKRAEKAKKERTEIETKRDEMTKKKYWVT